jgi:hypothetical protein
LDKIEEIESIKVDTIFSINGLLKEKEDPEKIEIISRKVFKLVND